MAENIQWTEKKFKEIVEAFPDTILIIGPDRKLLEMYPEASKEKYPRLHRILNHHLSEYSEIYMPVEHTEEIFDILNHIEADRSSEYSIKANIQTEKFGTRTFDISFKAFNDNKFLVIVRDVTEKEKLQILIDFQAAIDKLSENNRKAMNTLFKI